MSTKLSKDDLYEVMANRRRRYTVHALNGTEEPMELGDIAEKVAAWENGVQQERVTYDERKRVYTALQQSHLPKMDEKGVINFDKDRGTVEPTDYLRDVEIYMDIVHKGEIPWTQFYLGLSGVSTALIAAVAMNAWPFTLLSDLSWAILIVVAFAVSSLAHWYYSHSLGTSNGEPPAEVSEQRGLSPE